MHQARGAETVKPKGKGGNPENCKPAKTMPVGGRTGGAEAMRRKVDCFVREFIATDSATQAAIAAGFKPSNAKDAGHRMMKRADVQEALKAFREEKARQFELRADDILRELSAIVHVDPRLIIDRDGSLLPIPSWPDSIAKAVSGIEVTTKKRGEEHLEVLKVKFSDKNSAIEKAMRHLGLFERDNKQKPASDAAAEALKALAERLPV
jgi:phage terminase small subunit